MSASQEAIFIGANKQGNSLDFSTEFGIAAFGASTTVALWNPFNSRGVYSTLKLHTGEVTGVKFIPGSKFLVSTSEDGLVVIWKASEDGKTFHEFQTLSQHEGSVTALATAPGIFATGGVDGNVVIWREDDNKWVIAKSFQVKTGFYPTCLALQDVFGEYVIAVGGTSMDVYIYTTSTSASKPVILKGHEDWIKTLAWTKEGDGWILASGSQDRYIRLWRIRAETKEDTSKLILLANRKEKLQLSQAIAEVFFEALIMGHDDWVTGLQWNTTSSTLQLLSSSADTGLMIWEMDSISGIWVCVSRLGEMSIKGASTATGSSGGFWSCLWLHKGDKEYILANGKTGSFRIYEKAHDSTTWTSILGITGPNKEVTDLVWSQTGEYFFATSLDQTTRLFSLSNDQGWRELARPQIHGYDMICIDNINDTKFVSGGDEKVLRVFEMTKDTADLLIENGAHISELEVSILPVTASLPVLGLSNKADNEATVKEGVIGEQGEEEEEGAEETDETKVEASEAVVEYSLPLEDQLQRTTLFPEIEKLYGHGYELTCCATTEGFIASACRSNSARHALIRVFDTKDYQMIHVLEGHNLTVTSMEFSPDGKYLVAVSRDRQVSLWDVNAGFKLIEINQVHNRIVWDITWLGNNHFITGSRDKLIKLWTINQEVGETTGFKLLSTEKFELPVSSVSSCAENDGFAVAVGMEEGIQVFKVELTSNSISKYCEFEVDITPSGRVSKLAWGKKCGEKLRLAVGSSDSSVRLYDII